MLEHEKWLAIAREDLAVAEVLLQEDFWTPVTYHAQQAAEKALKGYLCYKLQPITKTHDLIMLLEQCMRFETGFEQLYSAASQLNPFATKFRYPTEFDIPDLIEAELALENAAQIIAFVLKQIT